jgi:hypothetical protein
VLSPSLMRRIVQFALDRNRVIELSFVESRVFVAIPHQRNLFEPSCDGRPVHFDLIRQYFEDLLLPLTLVRYLNLNTRICSKL